MPVEEINFSDYERQILLDPAKYFAGGKRVSNDIYIHIDHPDTRRFLDIVSRIYQWPADANVLRVSRNPDKRTASFSHYVDFLDDPFPALKWSHHFDLVSGNNSRRNEGKNPAILHRKELLLWPEHPRLKEYETLTAALIKNKLLPAKSFVGRRDHWNHYLLQNGFVIRGGFLSPLKLHD